MEANEFVKKIRNLIIDENLSIYKGIFETTPKSQITDEYWKAAINMFEQLNIKQKEILYKIIRQVEVDTISNVFGVIDGAVSIDNNQNEFELKVGGNMLNGDLQDLLLEQEEMNNLIEPDSADM